MKLYLALVWAFLLLPSTAFAQFTGPSVAGKSSTVEQVRKSPVGTYVVVMGNLTSHLREDYYTFQDQTGEIRVEIEEPVWRSRQIGPETKVRLMAEVDRSLSGVIYLWVKSLEPAS